MQHVRTFLYAAVLATACLGWWHEARQAARLKGRLTQIEHHLNQADLRITALSLAVLDSFGGGEAIGRPVAVLATEDAGIPHPN